jgi:hypothetical protein
MQVGLDSLTADARVAWKDSQRQYPGTKGKHADLPGLTYRVGTSSFRGSLTSPNVGPSPNRKDRHGH